MMVAREMARWSGTTFTPTAAPYVAPTYRTTVNATATSDGQTNVSGTATTTADYSGQAGANIGNAIGNAIAAHHFYKLQREDLGLSRFLAAHTQADYDSLLQPGQSRTIVAIFEQPKHKKKPFEVILNVGSDTFHFDYKE